MGFFFRGTSLTVTVPETATDSSWGAAGIVRSSSRRGLFMGASFRPVERKGAANRKDSRAKAFRDNMSRRGRRSLLLVAELEVQSLGFLALDLDLLGDGLELLMPGLDRVFSGRKTLQLELAVGAGGGVQRMVQHH